jgi:hypothetical protein
VAKEGAVSVALSGALTWGELSTIFILPKSGKAIIPEGLNLF